MSSESIKNKIPPGFKLRQTLWGHKGWVGRIAWAPDGERLASSSGDKTIRIWHAEQGELCQTLQGYTEEITNVAWSPDGQLLASASRHKTIQLWEVATGKLLRELQAHSVVYSVTWSPNGSIIASGANDTTIRLWDSTTGEQHETLTGHSERVTSIIWSPDSRTLASASDDRTIRLWDMPTGERHRILKGHSDYVNSVAWSLDGSMLASASTDKTVRLWDAHTGKEIGILEGHTASVNSVCFSNDGRLLASQSSNGRVLLWRCDKWELVTALYEGSEGSSSKYDRNPVEERILDDIFRDEILQPFLTGSLAFHPKAPVLATLGEDETVIQIWNLDLATLLGAAPSSPSVYYTNAKVVLVGDSGVGKSGLGLVLTGQPFAPTESTHGRRIWTFDSQQAELDGDRKETRETLLWDLAGQPGYRHVHQLNLTEVAIALVVFDGRSETDPFAGVRYWDRALRQAQRVQGDSARVMKKFLVAARTDRGGISVSRARIDTLVNDLGFEGYFETSAKAGWDIARLAETIREKIDWNTLPKVSSTELFQNIKAFLIEEKEAGRLLSTADDLYRLFLNSAKAPAGVEDLRAQFNTCIGRVEARGLIRRLSFGDLILLQPELLDAYASAMVNEAKDEPDGLGSIAEEDARAGRFRMPTDERIHDKDQEKLLLIATVEDLLRHEIALREAADDGPRLVFPSQLTREHPDLPDPAGKAVVFRFEGPMMNIYATLAVRLSHSGIFKKKEMWKNAATFMAMTGGTCGMFLRELEEGRGELTLFFDPESSEETRFQFAEYIHAHLKRRALPESIHRRRIFVCQDCGTPVTDLQAQRRRERGFKRIWK